MYEMFPITIRSVN